MSAADSQGAARSRDEKILRREILNALGSEPDVLVMVNESNVFTQLLQIMPRSLQKEAYRRVLPEERYGLGIGSPDLVCVVRGVFLGLEIKRPGDEDHDAGQLSPNQRDWHAAAGARGVRVERVRSIEEARAAVDRVRRAAL